MRVSRVPICHCQNASDGKLAGTALLASQLDVNILSSSALHLYLELKHNIFGFLKPVER